jgi:hypothetical protein
MLGRPAISTVYVILDSSVVKMIVRNHEDQPAVLSIIDWLENKPAPQVGERVKRLVVLTSQKLEREVSSKFAIIAAKRTLFKVQWLWDRSVQVETKFASQSWIDSRLSPDLRRRINMRCRRDLREVGDDIKFIDLAMAIFTDSNRSNDRGFLLGVKDRSLSRAVSCCVDAISPGLPLQLVTYDELWNAITDC